VHKCNFLIIISPEQHVCAYCTYTSMTYNTFLQMKPCSTRIRIIHQKQKCMNRSTMWKYNTHSAAGIHTFQDTLLLCPQNKKLWLYSFYVLNTFFAEKYYINILVHLMFSHICSLYRTCNNEIIYHFVFIIILN
jgi:hypothetical protein